MKCLGVIVSQCKVLYNQKQVTGITKQMRHFHSEGTYIGKGFLKATTLKLGNVIIKRGQLVGMKVLNQIYHNYNFLTCKIPPPLMNYMSRMNQSFPHNSTDQVTENQEEISQRQNSLVQRTTTCHPWTECKWNPYLKDNTCLKKKNEYNATYRLKN